MTTPKHPMPHGPWLTGPDGDYCGECLLLRRFVERTGAGCRPAPVRRNG